MRRGVEMYSTSWFSIALTLVAMRVIRDVQDIKVENVSTILING